uniref:Uncharacterized protein n=1 Tax=Romanomermis culicivorax TaxID=13658 RepID=A0A915KRA7_ROMCU
MLKIDLKCQLNFFSFLADYLFSSGAFFSELKLLILRINKTEEEAVLMEKRLSDEKSNLQSDVDSLKSLIDDLTSKNQKLKSQNFQFLKNLEESM